MPTSIDLNAALKQHFGFTTFRPGQEDPIHSVLNGENAIVVMPTGSGKSLCFQLPALLLPGTTLVISPLIALMKDQVDNLVKRGISAALINSSQSAEQLSYIQSNLERGTYKLVYIAPERFRNPTFMAYLARTQLSMIVVDEAHCISQWGHDFRPDYLYLQEVVKQFPQARIMAVTATATEQVCKHIQSLLSPTHPTQIKVTGFERPNLYLKVTQVKTHADKLVHTLRIIKTFKCGIVYCSTRKMVERVHTLLRNEGVKVVFYHGSLPDSERIDVQNRFMSEPNSVVVATNAFGMGIDRSDIRFVVHWDVPGSIEAYYQEIGRAGRDNRFSWCELLFNYADIHTQTFFLDAANPQFGYVRELYASICDAISESATNEINVTLEEWAQRTGIKNVLVISTTLALFERAGIIQQNRKAGSRNASIKLLKQNATQELQKIADRLKLKRLSDEAKLDEMKHYVYSRQCRHHFLISYFGEQPHYRSCKMCSHCAGTLDHIPQPRGLRETELIVLKKIISCLVRMKSQAPLSNVIKVLQGKGSDFQDLSTYGLLSDYSENELDQLLFMLSVNGAISGTTVTRHGLDIVLDKIKDLRFPYPLLPPHN